MDPKIMNLVVWVFIGSMPLLTLLILSIWLPVVWRHHVDNARWLYNRGDRSWLVVRTLALVRSLKRSK